MPLGPSGIKTDIVTGQPVMDNRARREAERGRLEAKLQETVQRSIAMQAEIKGPGKLVIDVLMEQMIEHVDEILANDPVYKNFLAVLQRLNHEVQMAPIVVERHQKKFLASYAPSPPSGIPDGE
jgi:hypothetical protein